MNELFRAFDQFEVPATNLPGDGLNDAPAAQSCRARRFPHDERLTPDGHDRLFEKQPSFRRDDLLAYAAELGLDRDAFAQCLDQRRFAADVERDIAQAQALGVNSTPAFLINGRPVVGALSVDEFRSIVEDALKGRR